MLFVMKSDPKRKHRWSFSPKGLSCECFCETPHCQGVGTIILDEFHERHLETDVTLAVLRSLQSSDKRPDLKLVFISTTLELSDLQQYWSDTPGGLAEIEITAPPHPLQIDYLSPTSSQIVAPLEKRVAEAVRESWNHPGDFLVFLPGMREIRRVQSYLQTYLQTHLHNLGLNHTNLSIVPLHGNLNTEEQNKALSERERNISVHYLLGLNDRPIQVTQDLSNFWQKTYKEMFRELSREYPKHYWSEDPMKARPVLLKRMVVEGGQNEKTRRTI